MSLTVKIHELKTTRKRLAEETGEIVVRAAREQRSLSGLEDERWHRSHNEIDRLASTIERLEQQRTIEQELGRMPADNRTASREDVSHHSAINCGGRTMPHLRHFPPGAGPYEKRTADGRLMNISEVESSAGGEDIAEFFQRLRHGKTFFTSEQRQLGGSGPVGDYVIPQSFVMQLDIALRYFGGILEAARYIDSPDGRLAPYASVNDIGVTSVGETTAENGAVTVANAQSTTPGDPLFGSIKNRLEQPPPVDRRRSTFWNRPGHARFADGV